MERILEEFVIPDIAKIITSFLMPSEQRVRKAYACVLYDLMVRSIHKKILEPLDIDNDIRREEHALEKTEIWKQYDAVNNNMKNLCFPQPHKKPKNYREKKKYGF